MGKYFTFIDRKIELEFFQEDPITVTMVIGDETSRRVDGTLEQLKAAAKTADHRKILVGLVGEDAAKQLLDRIGEADNYAIDQLILYVHGAYIEHLAKNLQAAKAGRERT